MRRIVRSAVVLATIAGCRQIFGLHEISGDAGGGGDARRDALTDGKLPANCVGTGRFAACWTQPPSGPLMLGNSGSNTPTIHTDGSNAACDPHTTWLDAANHDACFLVGTDVSIAGNTSVRFEGSKPVVIVATSGTIDVEGDLDVSSVVAGNTGAAANAAECTAGAAPGPGGGGPGGSFITRGGDGGKYGGGGAGIAAAADAAAPMQLRGGCTGGGVNGIGGAGGGAIELLAAQGISLGSQAWIDASGAGGLASQVSMIGGGGGGAGGMIALVAPSISTMNSTYLFADGGGGGGSYNQGAQMNGTDPAVQQGGGPGNGGAFGGAGGHDNSSGARGNDGPSGTPYGGGGGGGGEGLIFSSVAITGSFGASPSVMVGP